MRKINETFVSYAYMALFVITLCGLQLEPAQSYIYENKVNLKGGNELFDLTKLRFLLKVSTKLSICLILIR